MRQDICEKKECLFAGIAFVSCETIKYQKKLNKTFTETITTDKPYSVSKPQENALTFRVT